MGLSAPDYRRQLQALLPQGLAWSRSEDATLTRFLGALAEEFARIDARAGQLVDEAVPASTSELLFDWERVAGLPDNCAGQLQDTVQGRRQALESKLISTGGQSRDYFKAAAAGLGFAIEIEEHRPFRIGSTVGSTLAGTDWQFAWRVRAPEVNVRSFRAGASVVGEALASWGNADLECRIRQLAPAHTIPQFAYGGIESTVLLLEQGGALINEGGTAVLLESA